MSHCVPIGIQKERKGQAIAECGHKDLFFSLVGIIITQARNWGSLSTSCAHDCRNISQEYLIIGEL